MGWRAESDLAQVLHRLDKIRIFCKMGRSDSMTRLDRNAAICAAALFWSGQAAAQATDPVPAEPAGGQAPVVDEIVVTAQKREQSLQDVPISITAFGEAQISALGAQSVGDLDTFTPGLSVNDTSVTQPKYTIRGVETDDFGIGTEPAVGIFVDGVYAARSGSALIFFNDVERVEVLKGPQGTLFGRNTSAGAISIITKKPSDSFEAEATARIGNYDKRRVDGVINIPLADTLALRVNGVYNKRDGYLRDAVTGADYEQENNWSGRAALRFRPSDATDILLSYDHDHTEKDGPAAVGIGPFALSDDPFGPFANDVLGGSREARRLHAVTLNISQDLGGVTLTSISAYKKFRTNNREDEDGTNDPAHYFDTENIENNRSFYQELRLAQNGDRLNWIAGVSYFRERARQTSATTALTDSIDTILNKAANFPIFSILDDAGLPVFGLPWQENMNNRARNRSFAAFGDVTWAATPEINLTAGLRYTKDKKRFSWLNGPHVATALSQVTAPGALYNAILGARVFPDDAPIDANTFYNIVGRQFGFGDLIFDVGDLEGVEFTSKKSFSDVSPRFVIDYKPSPDVLLYASASRGYKAGGFNSVQINSFFKPESVWNFEGGFKSELFDRRLRFNASAYYFKYRNRQSISLESSESGVPQYKTSSGDSEAFGIDFETQFVVTPGFTLSATGGYIDSKWVTRFEQGEDISGQPTGEPSFRGVLSARFEREFSGFGQIYADASYSYTARQRLNDAIRASDNILRGIPTSAQPFGPLVDFSKLGKLRSSREIVNARIGWRSLDERFSITVFAENLFDVRTPRTLNPITATTLGTPYVRLDRPRFWGMEFGVRF
jgi:iron complex outermembrane receptor protein